jgi:F0F1-type ATP synthase assembly protein I
MFVPSIVVIGGALWADLHWGTKPWLTIISVPIGLACSVLLVRRQLREVE